MKYRFTFILLLLLSKAVLGQVFDTVSYYHKYTPKQLHEDLDFLLKKFETIHPDYYVETPKDTVRKRYKLLKARITQPMTRIDFMDLFAPVAYGVIKDGHNYVNMPQEDVKAYTDRGGKFFPLPVIIWHGKLLVNATRAAIPYHAEIVTINGVAAHQIVKTILNTYNPEDRDYEERFLSDYFNQNYWQTYGPASSYDLIYKEDADDKMKNVVLPVQTEAEIGQLRSQPPAKKKNYMLEYPNYAFYEKPELSAGVMEYKACDDLEHFRPFCDSVFRWMREKPYKNLIIDIRDNTGGTTRLNDILFEYLTDKPLTQYAEIDTKISKEGKKDFITANRKYAHWFRWYNYLYYPIHIRINQRRKQMLTAQNGTVIKQTFSPENPNTNPLKFTGNIYLLTSKATYSSAAIFAAAFKCYHLGTIIGQETGEPTCFTGDWVGITLPNTKLACAISNKRYIWPAAGVTGMALFRILSQTIPNWISRISVL